MMNIARKITDKSFNDIILTTSQNGKPISKARRVVQRKTKRAALRKEAKLHFASFSD